MDRVVTSTSLSIQLHRKNILFETSVDQTNWKTSRLGLLSILHWHCVLRAFYALSLSLFNFGRFTRKCRFSSRYNAASGTAFYWSFEDFKSIARAPLRSEFQLPPAEIVLLFTVSFERNCSDPSRADCNDKTHRKIDLFVKEQFLQNEFRFSEVSFLSLRAIPECQMQAERRKRTFLFSVLRSCLRSTTSSLFLRREVLRCFPMFVFTSRAQFPKANLW